ncbi:MAG: hypothetical protein JEY99_04525 [Spirochaetales bacterium]|nr:hypothetical protein [Spirochaetales bacterium]
MTARIYSLDEFKLIPWPEDASSVQNWFMPFSENPIQELIRNVQADIFFIHSGNVFLPLTLGHRAESNSYICSPKSHYITYALEEAEKLSPRPLGSFMKGVIRLLGAFLDRGSFEPAVYVNNWLLSTNLYSELKEKEITTIHKLLLNRFDTFPIAFRSVDGSANPLLLNSLAKLGYEPVFSRYVWYQEPDSDKVRRKRSFKLDKQIFDKSGYTLISSEDFRTEDYLRAEVLYNQLYLDKYSPLNPQFTGLYMEKQCLSGALQLRGLVREGRMDGVFGFYVRHGYGTCPIFGYDIGLPKTTGLYRALSYCWVEEASRLGVKIHASSGAGAFKKHRGAEPALEYNMVYTRHLPRAIQRRWHLLKVLTDRIAVPLIARQEL